METVLGRAVIRSLDRRVTYTWLGAMNGDGESAGVRLEMLHDKDRKRLVARFVRFVREQRDGYAMERYDIGCYAAPSNMQTIASAPCQRYSPKQLAAFHDQVVALLGSDPESSESHWLAEAGNLVGVTA